MKRLIVVFMAFALVLTATTAMAVTESSTLDVLANVVSRCRITGTTNVDFGNYDPTDPADNIAGQGSVTFRCTRGTNYEMYIVRNNQMLNGPEILTYELYDDAARTSVYPTALPGISGSSANNAPVTEDIYGRIPALQDAIAGGYSETVTFTIDY